MVAFVGSSIIGGLASAFIVVLWLYTFHKKLFLSLLYTKKLNAYGVYTEFGEALGSHFWFLIKGLFATPDRAKLEAQVKDEFLEQLGESKNGQCIVTHSCRSVFYYVIRTLLEESEERTGEMKIRIAIPALHFGSFFRLLRGMEKSMNCKIEFYEVDLKEDDWTLDYKSIDENELKSCDLVMCQHLFGVPFTQDKLVELGKKHNIPILEDCVQSGSLYGQYKGNPSSDIIMFSGGLDKTPQCFGAGLSHFRDTAHGNHFYKKCSSYHESLPLDTLKARSIGSFNQMLHLMIAKNSFGINNILGLIAYVWISERGDFIKWYALSLKVRKNKAVTPFQHAESGFLRRPSPYQLQSILYGLSKTEVYSRVAAKEIRNRELLLSNIPSKYHRILFPWFTEKVLQRHKENMGISEFTWVVSPRRDRAELCEFLNEHFVVVLVNTTWEVDANSKKHVSRDVNNNLTYLPNLNQSNDELIVHVAKTLTKFCDMIEGEAVTSKK